MLLQGVSSLFEGLSMPPSWLVLCAPLLSCVPAFSVLALCPLLFLSCGQPALGPPLYSLVFDLPACSLGENTTSLPSSALWSEGRRQRP